VSIYLEFSSTVDFDKFYGYGFTVNSDISKSKFLSTDFTGLETEGLLRNDVLTLRFVISWVKASVCRAGTHISIH
jgi:hypothetical protein